MWISCSMEEQPSREWWRAREYGEPIPASFPTGSSTLVVLPLDEMNTPISAFKGKGQALMPKTPSKSPCPKKVTASFLLSLLSLRTLPCLTPLAKWLPKLKRMLLLGMLLKLHP